MDGEKFKEFKKLISEFEKVSDKIMELYKRADTILNAFNSLLDTEILKLQKELEENK